MGRTPLPARTVSCLRSCHPPGRGNPEASQKRFSHFKSWTPPNPQKPYSILHLQPPPRKSTGHQCPEVLFQVRKNSGRRARLEPCRKLLLLTRASRGWKRIAGHPTESVPKGTGQSVARHGSAGWDCREIESRRDDTMGVLTQTLKPSLATPGTARLKSCPDTKHQNG